MAWNLLRMLTSLTGESEAFYVGKALSDACRFLVRAGSRCRTGWIGWCLLIPNVLNSPNKENSDGRAHSLDHRAGISGRHHRHRPAFEAGQKAIARHDPGCEIQQRDDTHTTGAGHRLASRRLRGHRRSDSRKKVHSAQKPDDSDQRKSRYDRTTTISRPSHCRLSADRTRVIPGLTTPHPCPLPASRGTGGAKQTNRATPPRATPSLPH